VRGVESPRDNEVFEDFDNFPGEESVLDVGFFNSFVKGLIFEVEFNGNIGLSGFRENEFWLFVAVNGLHIVLCIISESNKFSGVVNKIFNNFNWSEVNSWTIIREAVVFADVIVRSE